MTIIRPSLKLIFADGGEDIVCGSYDILANSITICRRLLSDLKSASDTVTLSLDRWSAAVQRLVATDEAVKAVLSSNGQPLFTGYVATDFTWSVTDTGRQTLGITLEDVGTRLLSTSFIDTGRHLFDCDVMAAVREVAGRCGIDMAYNQPQEKGIRVTNTVEAGEVCRDILTDMLYEADMCFSFDANGRLQVHDLGWSGDDAITIDRGSLALVGSNSISLSKRIRQYRGARISYSGLERASDYLIYRNTTGQDSGHPYCNLEMDGNTVFDGARMYTSSEWAGLQDDDYTGPSLVEAVNATSEQETVASGRIISISDPVLTVTSLSYVFRSVRAEGGPYFSLVIENRSSMQVAVTRLDVTADIIYEKDTNILLSSAEGNVGGDTLEETLVWVHDREQAGRHANLVAQYHRHAGCAYTFYTFADVEAGSVVRLVDDVHSGLSTLVLVVATTETDESGVVSCEAVGLGPFDLSAPLHFQTLGYAGRAPLPVDDPEDQKPEPTLDVSVDKGSVTWYADDEPVDPDEEIVLSFTRTGSSEPVVVSYLDTRVQFSTDTGTHRIRSSQFRDSPTVIVTVTCGTLQRSVTLVKVHLVGSLELSFSSGSIGYFADDVPHDPQETVIVTFAQEGYAAQATLNIQGLGIVASGSGSFKVKATDMIHLDSMLVQYGIAGVRMESGTIYKAKDVGVLELSLSASSFLYSADNWPVDEAERILCMVGSSGFSTAPILRVEGLEVDLSPEGVHEFSALDILDQASLAIEAVCFDQVRTASISKIRQQASIRLFLSRTSVRYFADGVECPDQTVEARIMHSGLHYGAHLVVGGRLVEADDDDVYRLPSGLLDGLSEVVVRAEGTRLVSVHDTAVLSRQVLEPSLSIFTDAASFTLSADGSLSPDGITVLCQWSGVSDAVRPGVTANGVSCMVDEEGHCHIPSSMAAGRTGVRVSAALPGFDIVRETYLPVVSSGKDGESVLVEYRWGSSRTEWEAAEELMQLVLDGMPLTLDGAPLTMEMLSGRSALMLDDVPVLLDGKPVVLSREEAGRMVLDGVPLTLAGIPLSLGPLVDEVDGGWSATHSLEAPEGRPYLWMRTSTDGGITWSYSCISGEQGPQGEKGEPGEKGDRGDPGDAGTYLGAHAEPPVLRPDGSSLGVGDYYLDTADPSNPLPYILQDNGIWRLVSSTDPDWGVIASVTQTDVAALGTSLLVTNSYYGYFSLLSAMQAGFDTVHTKTMVIRDGGRIVSRSHLDSGGVEGFEISDEGIFASTGSWNAGINSGTLRCIPDSRLSDGRDAFDFRCDVTLGEYWERFKALRINSNRFLHVPTDFAEYYRGVNDGKFAAPVEMMTGSFYGIYPLSWMAEHAADGWGMCVLTIINRHNALVWYFPKEAGSASMVGIVDAETFELFDPENFNMDAPAPILKPVTGYAEELKSVAVCVTDEFRGKVFLTLTDGQGGSLRLYSFPVMEEYGESVTLTEETSFSIDRRLGETGFLSSLFGIRHPKSYGPAGISCMVSGIGLLDGHAIGLLAEFDFASLEARLVYRMPLATSSPEASPFIYSAVREGGATYALATLPEEGLCLIRIDSEESYTLLRMVYEDNETTWRTWPFYTNPDDYVMPVYCSASLSSHDGRLLACASRQRYGRASFIPSSTSGGVPSNFIEEPPLTVEHTVFAYDIVTGVVTDVELPQATLLPNLANDVAWVGSVYGTTCNTNGVRPPRLSTIPKTLRWNPVRGGYDLFATLLDISVAGKITDPQFAGEIADGGWINLVDCMCRLDDDLVFVDGLTQKLCSEGMQQAMGAGVKMLPGLAFKMMCLDLSGDTYLAGDSPMYMFSNCLLLAAQSGGTGITSHSILGWRRSMRGLCKAWMKTLLAAMGDGEGVDVDGYLDLFSHEPALGPVVGLDVRYDEEADAYDIQFITDERTGAYSFMWAYRHLTLMQYTSAAIGCELGNGKYTFDRFIPQIRLTKGDRTLCPVTIDLHTNALTFFDN